MQQSTKLEMVHEIIRNLAAALSTAALYSPDHPQIMEHFARLTDSFRSLLSKDAELLLALVDGELLYLGKPLVKTVNVERLLRYGTEQKVGYIRFAKGFGTVELQQLVKVLQLDIDNRLDVLFAVRRDLPFHVEIFVRQD